jgi:pimeloyl-ACP methyl ester carboxylesterase
MLRAEVGGLSVAYERAGDGPTRMLLHGFTHDSRAWWPQLQSLSDQFTVIVWDAPGAGQSVDPPETFGIADWADCLAGLFDAVCPHRRSVMGWAARPGVLPALRRARAVAGVGRYVRRLEGFSPRADPRGAPGGLPARCLAATGRVRAEIPAGHVQRVAETGSTRSPGPHHVRVSPPWVPVGPSETIRAGTHAVAPCRAGSSPFEQFAALAAVSLHR